MDKKFVPQQNQGDPGLQDLNNPNYQQFQQQFQMSQQMAQRMSQQQQQQHLQQQQQHQQQQQQQHSTSQQQPHMNDPNVMNSADVNFANIMGSNNSNSGTPANIEQLNNQKKLLNTYIQDFLLKSNLKNSADSFSKEAEMDLQGKLCQSDNGINSSGSSVSPGDPTQFKPLYDTRQGFLYEWWQLFWDLFNIKSNRDGSEIAQVYYQIINSQRQLEQIQRNIAIQAAKTQYIAERRGEYKNESLEPMELAQLLSKQPALMNFQRSMNSPMSNAQFLMQQQQAQAQAQAQAQRQAGGYIPSRTSQQMRAPMQGPMANPTVSPGTASNGSAPNNNTQKKKQLLQQRQQQIQQQLLLQQQQQQGYGGQQVPNSQFPMNQQQPQQQNYDMSMNDQQQQQVPYMWNQKNNLNMSMIQQQPQQQMSPTDTTRSSTQGGGKATNEKRSRNDKTKQDSNRSNSISSTNNNKSFVGTPGSSYRNQYANDNTTGNPMNQNAMGPVPSTTTATASFGKGTAASKRKASTQKEKGKTTRQTTKKKRSTSTNNSTAANTSAPNSTANNATGSGNTSGNQSGSSVVSTPIDTKGTPNFTFVENKNIHNTPGTMKKLAKRSFSASQFGPGISDPNSPRTVGSTHGLASAGPTSNKKDMLPPNGVSPHVIYSPQYKPMGSQGMTPRNPVPESLSKDPSKNSNDNGKTRRKSTTSLNNKTVAAANMINSNGIEPSSSAGNTISWEPLVANPKNGKNNNNNNKFSSSEPVTPLYSSIVPATTNSAKQSSQLSTVDEQSAFHEMNITTRGKSNTLSAKNERTSSTISKNGKGKHQKGNKNGKQGGTSDRSNSSKSSAKDVTDSVLLTHPEGLDTTSKGHHGSASNSSNDKHSSILDVHDNIAHNYNVEDSNANYMFGNDIPDDDMLFMNTIMDNDKDHFGMKMNMNMGMGVDMDIPDTDLLNKDLHPTASQDDSKKDGADDQLNPADDMGADNDFPFNGWT